MKRIISLGATALLAWTTATTPATTPATADTTASAPAAGADFRQAGPAQAKTRLRTDTSSADPVPTGARRRAGAPGGISWAPCPRPSSAECGTLRVPLDPAQPSGRQITLAVNRIKGTARSGHLGALLVNPGGPGASGRDLARFVATRLPKDVAARYDVIGVDPRGVGASVPSLSCMEPKRFYATPRVDEVPVDAADEARLIQRARSYAEACGAKWSWFLPYLTTENTARDLDAVRRALGEEKISYFGYSYGTYLGAVYATLFPSRVKRLVLDSVVDPAGVWYDANVAQDYAFDRRHQDFLGWVAAHDSAFHLGASQAAVSQAWYGMRAKLRTTPAQGTVGPSELDDLFTLGGYNDRLWPLLGRAFSDYVRTGDARVLVAAYRANAGNTAEDENSYAVYLGIQCRDAAWPRDWAVWHADTARIHATAPFMAWPNAVYNAPCAFWPVPSGTPPRVGTAALPPVLLIQAEKDAATPYLGALHMRALFPTARLVTEPGGNHGVSLSGNTCVDRHLAAYLRDATVPPRLSAHLPARLTARHGDGADATCPSLAAPLPLTSKIRGVA